MRPEPLEVDPPEFDYVGGSAYDAWRVFSWALLVLIGVAWVILSRLYGLDLLTIAFGLLGLCCISLSLWVARREHLNGRRR